MLVKSILTTTALCLLFTSCSGKVDKTTSDSSAKQSDELVQQQLEFTDIADLLAKKKYAPHELRRLCTFLYQKEAVITGYPYAYPADKEVQFIPGRTEMIDAKNNSESKVNISITFKGEEEPRTLKMGELFAVKGKLNISYTVHEKWGNSLNFEITDAEFVEEVTDTKNTLSSIAAIDLKQAIFCGDLNTLMTNHYESLVKRGPIELTGDYQLTTTSTNSSGTSWNLSIGESPTVFCYTLEEPDNKKLDRLRSEGKQITVHGHFGGCAMKNVTLLKSTIDY